MGRGLRLQGLLNDVGSPEGPWATRDGGSAAGIKAPALVAQKSNRCFCGLSNAPLIEIFDPSGQNPLTVADLFQ